MPRRRDWAAVVWHGRRSTLGLSYEALKQRVLTNGTGYDMYGRPLPLEPEAKRTLSPPRRGRNRYYQTIDY